MFKTMTEASEAIKMASANLKDTKLQAGDDQYTEVMALYADVMSDLEQLKSKLGTMGCPRSAETMNQAIRTIDSCKAILEEELAKPT